MAGKFIRLTISNGDKIYIKKSAIYEVEEMKEKKSIRSCVYFSTLDTHSYVYVKEPVEEIMDELNLPEGVVDE